MAETKSYALAARFTDPDVYGRANDAIFGKGAALVNKREAMVTLKNTRSGRSGMAIRDSIDYDLYGRGDPRIFGRGAHIANKKEAFANLHRIQRNSRLTLHHLMIPSKSCSHFTGTHRLSARHIVGYIATPEARLASPGVSLEPSGALLMADNEVPVVAIIQGVRAVGPQSQIDSLIAKNALYQRQKSDKMYKAVIPILPGAGTSTVVAITEIKTSAYRSTMGADVEAGRGTSASDPETSRSDLEHDSQNLGEKPLNRNTTATANNKISSGHSLYQLDSNGPDSTRFTATSSHSVPNFARSETAETTKSSIGTSSPSAKLEFSTKAIVTPAAESRTESADATLVTARVKSSLPAPSHIFRETYSIDTDDAAVIQNTYPMTSTPGTLFSRGGGEEKGDDDEADTEPSTRAVNDYSVATGSTAVAVAVCADDSTSLEENSETEHERDGEETSQSMEEVASTSSTGSTQHGRISSHSEADNPDVYDESGSDAGSSSSTVSRADNSEPASDESDIRVSSSDDVTDSSSEDDTEDDSDKTQSASFDAAVIYSSAAANEEMAAPSVAEEDETYIPIVAAASGEWSDLGAEVEVDAMSGNSSEETVSSSDTALEADSDQSGNTANSSDEMTDSEFVAKAVA
jgi:hypothetical protein